MFSMPHWLHELIDHLWKHPQAESIALPTLAAVATAAQQPAPTPAAQPAPAAPSGFDWSKYAGQTDNVAFVAFAMAGHGNPQDADKAAAYAAGVVKTQVPTPTGEVNNSLAWESFDGHHPYADFQPGVPVVITVKLDAAAYSAAGAQPGAFNVQLGETSGTVPCTMSAVVRDEAGSVFPTESMGGGNGASLHVPYQLGQLYTVAFTAPVATRWGISVTP